MGPMRNLSQNSTPSNCESGTWSIFFTCLGAVELVSDWGLSLCTVCSDASVEAAGAAAPSACCAELLSAASEAGWGSASSGAASSGGGAGAWVLWAVACWEAAAPAAGAALLTAGNQARPLRGFAHRDLSTVIKQNRVLQAWNVRKGCYHASNPRHVTPPR